MPNHRGHRRAAAPLTRPFMPFPSSFPVVPARQPEKWPVVDSLRPQHPNYRLQIATYLNAIAVLFTTRIAVEAKTGAALSGPQVMAVEPEISRRKCAKARIAASETTRTFTRSSSRDQEGQQSLVAVGRYSLLIVLQVLLKAGPIGNQLFDLGFQLPCPLGQFLELNE